jgi:hypothetical protein
MLAGWALMPFRLSATIVLVASAAIVPALA